MGTDFGIDQWSDAELRIVADIRREFGSLWGDHDVPADSNEGQARRSHREIIIQRFIDSLPANTTYGSVYRQPYSLALHLRAFRDAAEHGHLAMSARQPDMEF